MAVEAEMKAIIHRLSQSGGPGLSGNLVDAEGFLVLISIYFLFELNDVVLLVMMQNQIKTHHFSMLLPLHSQATTFREIAMDADLIISKTFALIDETADAFPAADDGLQLGDHIVKFGKVETGENLLERLASEGRSNLGPPVVEMIEARSSHQLNSDTPNVARQGFTGVSDVFHFSVLVSMCLLNLNH